MELRVRLMIRSAELPYEGESAIPLETAFMQKRSGFTLIELLVVIAIIAILAAILFPVFAQAKTAAKKTQALSSIKQTGTAAIIYLGDYDDKFPSAYAMYNSGNSFRYWYSFPATVPAGWPDPSYFYLEDEDKVQWANSIQPYMKNYAILEMPGEEKIVTNWTFAPGRNTKHSVGFSMNGFLSHYEQTAITQVSNVPLFWQDDDNWEGFAWANPYLTCTGTGPCRYNPTCQIQSGWSGSFCTNMYSGLNQFHYGKSGVVVNADSSARSNIYGHRISTTPAPQAPHHKRDPYRRYDANGTGYSPYYCGTYLIECIFRPDKED